MLLVEGNNISFKYKEQSELQLRKISFTINNKSKIGLVGENGCGKSTLLKLILGESQPNNGVIKKRKDLKIGYLPQETIVHKDLTVEDYFWQAEKDLKEIKEKIQSKDMEKESNFYLYSEFSELGGYDFEIKLEKSLRKFHLDETDILNRPVISLSGGEKTKVALSRLLLAEVDIILFDEPTNNLDIDSLHWLEDYLKTTLIPFVVISHDREFLDNCVIKIWEISKNEMRVFTGNYTDYKTMLDIEFKNKMEIFEKQQKKIKQLTKASVKRRNDANKMENFKHSRSVKKNGGICKKDEGSGSGMANPTKKMRSAKAVEKRIEIMLEKEKANRPMIEKKRVLKLQAESNLKNRFCLEINELGKSFSKEVFSNINLVVPSKSRVAIVGPNGSGKTTLLRCIMEIEKQDKGEILYSQNLKLSYFAQNYENINYDLSIIEAVMGLDSSDQTQARTILGCLGIQQEKVYQKVGTLSPGERSKVSLAQSILSKANLIILDEPTNHLEIKARVAIEKALAEFDGSIIFVSHDRRFIENISTHVFDMKSSVLFTSFEDYQLS